MRTTMLLTCEYCNKKFSRGLNHINCKLRRQDKHTFCSVSCFNIHQTKRRSVNCTTCNVNFKKSLSQINKSKSGNHFCSRSCSATYNNKNKKHGTRRSKLEVWLEQELIKLHPNHNILFNDKSTIKSELDIYFPNLKLAIEINGIFHYKPIYGEDKLKKIQDNDKQKALLCEEHAITLHNIDVSSYGNFKEQTAKKYLDMILEILVAGVGFEPTISDL